MAGLACRRRYWERRVLRAWDESERGPWGNKMGPDDYARVAFEALEIDPRHTGGVMEAITNEYEVIAQSGASVNRLARWFVRRVRG